MESKFRNVSLILTNIHITACQTCAENLLYVFIKLIEKQAQSIKNN